MTVSRIVDPDAIAVLERLDPSLVDEGRVTLIGLDAVREALGERWARKREQVWSHADTHIARRLQPGDVAQRVSETDYLIACPGLGAAAARGLALQMLAEVLTYFLGRADPASLHISNVTGLGAGTVQCAPLGSADVARLLGAAPIVAVPLAPPPRRTAVVDPTWVRTPVRLGSGLTLSMTTWSEPVTHIRAGRRIGLRLARELATTGGRVLSAVERERLEPVELAELDIALLAVARDVMGRERRAGGLTLLPLSFAAFANASARLRLTRALGGLDADERAASVLEVEDLAAGTPPGRIVETIGFMRPYGRAVMVRAAPTRAAVEALRSARVQGVSLDVAGLDGAPGEVFGRLKLLRERSRGIAPEMLALGLPAQPLAAIAVAAGASFYSVRPDQTLALAQTA